ncbi:hypothetical protein HGRIS_012041 [Hohenbuehelia grisea]|uniref:Uncharacterized protein n=1 Tax=Hohenbuehelia grisea TaxID=104357 RepID=A0ABR3IR26_9AGAR
MKSKLETETRSSQFIGLNSEDLRPEAEVPETNRPQNKRSRVGEDREIRRPRKRDLKRKLERSGDSNSQMGGQPRYAYPKTVWSPAGGCPPDDGLHPLDEVLTVGL